MQGRNYTSETYRFGYQGSEKETGVSGMYTTEYRALDVRLGRWSKPDAITQEWQTPYCSMDNNPVLYTDLNGDKIRGSLKGMISYYKYKKEIAKAIIKLTRVIENTEDDNVVEAASQLMQNLIEQQLNLRRMKDSKVVFHIMHDKLHDRNNNDQSKTVVRQNRRLKKGRIDIILNKGGNDNIGLASASEIASRFLSGEWSFTNVWGDKYSLEAGELIDQNDLREIIKKENFFRYPLEEEAVIESARLLESDASDELSKDRYSKIDPNTRNLDSRANDRYDSNGSEFKGSGHELNLDRTYRMEFNLQMELKTIDSNPHQIYFDGDFKNTDIPKPTAKED